MKLATLVLFLGACAPSAKTVPVNVRVDVGGQVTESVEQIELEDEGAEYGPIGVTPGGQPVLMLVPDEEDRGYLYGAAYAATQLPTCGYDKEKMVLAEMIDNGVKGTAYVCFNSSEEALSDTCMPVHEASVDTVREPSACQFTVTSELVEWSKLQECQGAERNLVITHDVQPGELYLVGYEGDPADRRREHHVTRVHREQSLPPIQGFGSSVFGGWDKSCIMVVTAGDLEMGNLLRQLSTAFTPN